MADILDKDLNAYDNSPATASPYFLKESEVTPSSFITGEDLERTIRIQDTLKEPIPVELRAFTRSGKQGSGAEVPLTVISDAINDIYEGTKVFAGTLGMQALDAEPLHIKVLKKVGIEIPGITNEDSDFQKTIELLNGRTFPARKAISRVIARSTADIENRKIVRALYDQSHSIDPKAPQVMLPRMLVDAMLLFVPGKSAGLVSRFAGGSRYAATNLAKNITSGVIFAGEGGSYAAETVQEYIDRTGDKNLERFTPEDAHALSALAVGAINTEIEKIGGVFPLMFGSLKRVGLRSNFGKVLAEGAIGEPFENFLQDITRLTARKIDGTTEETWKDGIQKALVNSLWTAPVGGVVGVYGHYSNRANLVKGIQATVPNITPEQATQVADAMIDTGIDIVLPNESLRKNLREKVALMYRDIDLDNKEDRIDAMTDLEYSLIAMDAIDRGIDIADHELFQGVVNELGWFRAGIPEAEREKIESINNNIRELRTQLEELNKAEEKDWAKIEEIENKLAQASQYVLGNLTDMRKAFQELEDKYVEKEFKATPEQIELSGKTATDIFDTLSNEGVDIQFANQGKTTKDAATYLQINRKGAKSFQIRFGVSPIGPLHPSVVANFNVETLTQEQILQHIRTLIENKYPRTNKKAKEGVNIGFGEEPIFQEQFDLADENARLDDIYPAYDGETIEVDGKERTVYNSNGERIAKSAEALRNFYKWFGDSKVVDYKDRPIVLYHGTDAEFDTFKLSSDGNFGAGIYMADSREVAKYYGNIIMPLYSKLLNPLDTSTLIKDMTIVDKVISDLEKSSLSHRNISIDKIKENPTDAKTILQWASDEIIRNNFDGIIYADQRGLEIVAFEPTQIKSVDNRGTYSSDTGNIYWQNRVSGAAPKTYRGAYIPEYRFILRANKMDASTLSHELAHDWMEVNFARYRSGKQGKDFMKAWGALEKALGIPEDATSVPRKASETFARAYEAWIVQNEDWAKLIAVEDKDKDAVEKLMKDYQGELRDIYNDITSPYFKQTWGKIGELKPELKAWFDRVVNITDLDTMVERGEMTESQAANEKLNRAIDTVIENTTDSDTKQALTEAKVLNDTSRYEVEGGNKNSIQQRLSNLAKDIDENNMVLKGEKYDTRRDMMQVAEAADNFVKTRLDDALAIINGEMAETEGLYKEDLYTALERLAVENGDLNLIDELKNSEVANRLAKELGQRVAGFRNIKQSTDIDVVSALKSLDMKFNKALDNKKAKQEYDAALKLLDESMKQQDKIADKELDNFLDELKCK